MTTTAGFVPGTEKHWEFWGSLFFMLVAVVFAGQHMQVKANVLLQEQADEAKALLAFQGTSVSGSAQKIEG